MSRKEYVDECASRFEGLFWAILVLNILGSIVGAIICFCFGIWWAGIACLADTVIGSLIFAFIKWAWDFLCSCILLKGTPEDKIHTTNDRGGIL